MAASVAEATRNRSPEWQMSRSNRDLAMISILIGCGLRRAEVSSLRKQAIQIRQGHWPIVDLVGRGEHIRTVPMPVWVKNAVDRWMMRQAIGEGRVLRAVSRHGSAWATGSPRESFGMPFGTAPAALSSTRPARFAPNLLQALSRQRCGLEQIQFLLRQASVLTPERYLGCKQQP